MAMAVIGARPAIVISRPSFSYSRPIIVAPRPMYRPSVIVMPPAIYHTPSVVVDSGPVAPVVADPFAALGIALAVGVVLGIVFLMWRS